jgi:hypothetical protein
MYPLIFAGLSVLPQGLPMDSNLLKKKNPHSVTAHLRIFFSREEVSFRLYLHACRHTRLLIRFHAANVEPFSQKATLREKIFPGHQEKAV